MGSEVSVSSEFWVVKVERKIRICHSYTIYLSTHIYNKYPTYTQHIVFDIKSKAGKEKKKRKRPKKKTHDFTYETRFSTQNLATLRYVNYS